MVLGYSYIIHIPVSSRKIASKLGFSILIAFMTFGSNSVILEISRGRIVSASVTLINNFNVFSDLHSSSCLIVFTPATFLIAEKSKPLKNSTSTASPPIVDLRSWGDPVAIILPWFIIASLSHRISASSI